MKHESTLLSSPFSILSITTFFILSASCSAFANDSTSYFSLNSPTENETVIGKKPSFSLKSNISLGQETLLVLLDDTDVSGLITRTGNDLSFKPVMVLPAGEHILYIATVDADGNPVEQEFFFSTRHSESFKEVYSNNELSLIYRGVLGHHTSSKEEAIEATIEDEWIVDDTTALAEEETVDDFSHASIDAYFSSESVIREGNWATSLAGNIRYFDQRADMFDPEKRGLSVIDFLLSTTYSSELFQVEIGLGDTGIEESTNTIDSLYRRGLQARVNIGNLTLTGFGVLAEEQYNNISGVGLRFNSNDHILGFSAKMDFFDKQMSLKAIYANGGEDGDSLGTWSEDSTRKGDVAGIVFATDFFAGQLLTEIEFDEAKITGSDLGYDQWDISDDTVGGDDDPKRDNAYRIRIGGLKSIYNYELTYEYTGPEYEVVGNQGLSSDRAGYSFFGGLSTDDHDFSLFANQYWDNVDNNATYQRITSLGGGLEYSYLGWMRFPVTISYERGSQRSADEPLEVDETAIDIDTTMLRIGYQDGPWMGDVSAAFSSENDRGIDDFDNELTTLYFSPGYSNEQFTIMPSWSYNSSLDVQSSVRTNSHTLTLDAQSLFFSEQLICELGGTYDTSTTDDDTMESNTSQGYARATYRFQELWNLLSPALALEYTQEFQKNIIEDTSRGEEIITLILSSTLPYSY